MKTKTVTSADIEAREWFAAQRDVYPQPMRGPVVASLARLLDKRAKDRRDDIARLTHEHEEMRATLKVAIDTVNHLKTELGIPDGPNGIARMKDATREALAIAVEALEMARPYVTDHASHAQTSAGKVLARIDDALVRIREKGGS